MLKVEKPLPVLEGEHVYLRQLCVGDVNDIYRSWMNDPSTNQFLESRFCQHSLESLKQYVREKEDDEKNAFFAIVLKEGQRHIGNIKLGPVDTAHNLADIGILLGAKDCWSRGYATEAIRLIVCYAFNHLGLHKVTAGCYAPNQGAIKTFLKAGFSQEGLRKEHCYYNGSYVDDVLLGLVCAH